MAEPHELLGVPPDASPEAVRAAYGAKVRTNHPDHGGAGDELAALKQARDIMLGVLPAKPTGTCKVCRGTGWVKTGAFKPVRCPRGC